MSELDDAIAALDRAVARLEAAPASPSPAPEDDKAAEIAGELTQRVDAALARIEKLLAEGG